MSAMELLTAVRERIALTLVVFNDGQLNRIRLQQLAQYGHAAGCEILNPDFEAFANAVGVAYARGEGDVEGMLRTAIQRDSSHLVEVVLGDSAAIRVERARGLARGSARRALRSSPLRWLAKAAQVTMTDASPGGARLPPALLADATWYGTLAAVRDLGSRGVPITLGWDAALAPVRWSRYVTSAVRCPATKDHERFLDWLHAFGDEKPGHVLYPTSDDTAWLIALNQAALAPKYRLYSPPPEAFATLLDKWRLTEAARVAGLATAEVWLPEDERDVERIAREALFPLFVKPRTQLLVRGGAKGSRVDRPQDLVRRWSAFRAALEGERTPWARRCKAWRGRSFSGVTPSPRPSTRWTGSSTAGATWSRSAATSCCNIPAAWVPASCSRTRPFLPAATSGLERLFGQAGFFGVFDAEFVVAGDRLLLIDVNPRFYNHMAFEIARGLALPWLAYLGALGDDTALRAAMDAPRPGSPGGPIVYVHRLPAALMLSVQGAGGKMSRAERNKWRRWMAIRGPRHRSGPGAWRPGAQLHGPRCIRR